MGKMLRKSFFWLIIFLLVGIGIFLFYLSYNDSNSSGAKSYLINKYNFREKELKSKKYTEYVYEDIVDCNTLWFKKCTDNKELLYSYTFILNDKDIINVYEDKKGNYTDDYKSDINIKNEIE